MASTSSTALSLTTGPDATDLVVLASASSAFVGQPVTLTAIVNVLGPGSGTPTGSVTFKNGTTSLGTETLATTGAERCPP